MTREPEDLGLRLALAVVTSSSAPLLMLDANLTVVAASASFARSFQLEPLEIVGRPIFALGVGEWSGATLRSLLMATANGSTVADYEMDLIRPGVGPRRISVSAQKLDYGDPTHARLLITVSDLTDSRRNDALRDNLVREKTVLMQEVQHRVANSLQIIASVLMQSARRVQSQETRGHLVDAHNRVMSIAEVQRQLSASSAGDVAIRPYFEQLCQSLAASMIPDPTQIELKVEADGSMVPADTSISLGLVVTELVLNALKHAFPDHRRGTIVVRYTSKGDDWGLVVRDDGVGLLTALPKARAGLGTSIVEALANNLRATVSTNDLQPGTCVAITRSGVVPNEKAVA